MWKKTKINLVFIDSEALPVTRQLTRSTKSFSLSLSKVKLLLINAHFSYMYMCCKWNVLPPELHTNHISLASFKCLLLQYYNEALHLYDADDIRTWKTISLSQVRGAIIIVRTLPHLYYCCIFCHLCIFFLFIY